MSRNPGQIDDRRVAALITQGMSNSAIARELGCNEASVRRACSIITQQRSSAHA